MEPPSCDDNGNYNLSIMVLYQNMAHIIIIYCWDNDRVEHNGKWWTIGTNEHCYYTKVLPIFTQC